MKAPEPRGLFLRELDAGCRLLACEPGPIDMHRERSVNPRLEHLSLRLDWGVLRPKPRLARRRELLLRPGRAESTRTSNTVYNGLRTKRMCVRTFFLFLVLSLALPSPADASARVALRWSAPVDCPTEEAVLAEVDRLLGARTLAEGPSLDVVAKVRRKDDGAYVVRLEIPGPDGPRVREVSAVSCAALGQATALIMAMMIDPEAALTAPANPEPPASEPRPESPTTKPHEPGKTPADTLVPPWVLPPLVRDKPWLGPEAKGPAPSPPRGKKAQISRPRFAAGFYLVNDLWSLPSPTVGFQGMLGVIPGLWKFQVGATYFIQKSSSFSELPNAGAQVSLFDLHVAAGRVIPVYSKIEIVPHVRFDVGRFQAASFGVSQVDRGSFYSLGFGAGGALSVRISKYVRTGLEVDGIMLLARPKFIVTGLGVAYEPPSIVGRLALGLEVQF